MNHDARDRSISPVVVTEDVEEEMMNFIDEAEAMAVIDKTLDKAEKNVALLDQEGRRYADCEMRVQRAMLPAFHRALISEVNNQTDVEVVLWAFSSMIVIMLSAIEMACPGASFLILNQIQHKLRTPPVHAEEFDIPLRSKS